VLLCTSNASSLHVRVCVCVCVIVCRCTESASKRQCSVKWELLLNQNKGLGGVNREKITRDTRPPSGSSDASSVRIAANSDGLWNASPATSVRTVSVRDARTLRQWIFVQPVSGWARKKCFLNISRSPVLLKPNLNAN